MKKVIALLLACVLVFGLSVTSFAAPSNETGTTVEDTTAKEKVESDFEGVLEEAEIEEEAGDMVVVGVFGSGTLPEAGADGYIYHTVEVEGLEKGDTAYILAFVDGKWINVTVEVVDGKITAKFPKAAPYVVITDKDVQNDVSDGGSPKTGDTAVDPMVFVGIIAVAAVGVAVTTRRRIA